MVWIKRPGEGWGMNVQGLIGGGEMKYPMIGGLMPIRSGLGSETVEYTPENFN